MAFTQEQEQFLRTLVSQTVQQELQPVMNRVEQQQQTIETMGQQHRMMATELHDTMQGKFTEMANKVPQLKGAIEQAQQILVGHEEKLEGVKAAGMRLFAEAQESAQRASNTVHGMNQFVAQVASDKLEVAAWSQRIAEEQVKFDTQFKLFESTIATMHETTAEKEKALAEKLNRSFDAVESRLNDAFKNMTASAEAKFASMGVSGGAGTLGNMGKTKVNIKDFAVVPLTEKADVHEFRKWQRTVELQLEACYDWKHFDLIVEKIRLEKTMITEASWKQILAQINHDKPHSVSDCDWPFEEKSRWFYHYVINKLNTKLFTATTQVQDKNGFEVLRIINDEMDRVPLNARFQCNLKLDQEICTGDKIVRMKDIKASCAMAAKLEAACVQYRRSVGAAPPKDK